jgi:hypothetical protein
MKKLIVLIGLVALTGCKKKNCDCGEVMDKDIDHYISSSGNVLSTYYRILFYEPCSREERWVSVDEEFYNSLGIGDIYCIP